MQRLISRIVPSTTTIRDSDEYMPHPAPEHEKAESDRMGATASLLKNLILPALISLAIWLFLSYIVIPLWQKYRGKYSRYIPLDTITSHSSSLRERIQSTFARYLIPSRFRENRQSRLVVNGGNSGEEGDFDEDEGEELYEVGDRRREALSLDHASRTGGSNQRRLSRDLEEGFRDDSDEEEEDTRNAR